MTSVAGRFFRFEERRWRALAFFAVLAAAFVSPNIGMPAGLPAIRLEQLVLAALLPSLFWYHWRTPAARRVTIVDGAFAFLGLSIALTLAYAPLRVPGVAFSLRDPFELARVAEYWLVYRLGLAAADWPHTPLGLGGFAAVAAVAGGAFAVVQYLEPDGFNDTVTAIWTPAHHLVALDRTGRAVGTIGNANYFGLASGLFLALCLSFVALRAVRGWRWYVAVAGASAAVLGLVLSQSRTATFATLAAIGVALFALALTRRRQAAYVPATAVVVVAAVVSITFVELVPPDFGSYHARFAPQELTEGSSVGIRLSRWRSIFAGLFRQRPAFCETGEVPGRPPARGHEPRPPVATPTGEVLARDTQRKAHVESITTAVLRYYCDEGHWPTEQPLDETLVPRYRATMPADPLTAAPYVAYVSTGGFFVAAQLENAADAEGPWFVLGTIPNMVRNPSFEHWQADPEAWSVIQGATARREGNALFGRWAARFTLPPGALVYQNVVFQFGLHRAYTVGLWAKASGDEAQRLEIYLVATFADGTRLDPYLTREVELPADGNWHHASLTFETASARITTLQLVLRGADGAPADVLVDGVTLNEGPLPLSFATATDVDPARLNPDDLPTFADSPFLGVGPRRDIQLGAVDNEYALFLDRFGLVGTVAYVALLVAAFVVGWRGYRRAVRPADGAVGFALAASVVLLGVFNVTAGSFYHFQLMAIVWGWVGAVAGQAAASQHSPSASGTVAEVSRG